MKKRQNIFKVSNIMKQLRKCRDSTKIDFSMGQFRVVSGLDFIIIVLDFLVVLGCSEMTQSHFLHLLFR